MKTPTFLEFAKEIRFPLTPAQRQLAATSFDREPVALEFEDLFNAQGVLTAAGLCTLVWLCGRASGKTTLGAAAVLWRAITADLRTLGAGEVAYGLLVAPDMKLAGQTLNFVNGWIESTELKRLVVSRASDSITLRRPDGKLVCIAIFAATRGGSAVRGKSIFAAALDEACFFRDQSAVVNDSDIYNAILPRLTKGAFILLESTPWTQSGLVHALFKENFGHPTTALVAKAPTARMRSDSPELLATIENERKRDPDNAAREFDCDWLANGAGNAFDLNSLNAAITDRALGGSGRVFVGGDLGLVNDPSAFVAVQIGPNNTVNVRDMLEIKPRRDKPLSLTRVMRDAAIFAERNGSRSIRVDHHSLEEARDAIKQAGLGLQLEPCQESSAAHELRYTSLIEAFKAGRICIPKEFSAITDQLARIIATPKPAGGWRFQVGRRDGNHADAAMALLLACEPLFRKITTIADLSPSAMNRLAQVSAHMGRGPKDFSGPVLIW